MEPAIFFRCQTCDQKFYVYRSGATALPIIGIMFEVVEASRVEKCPNCGSKEIQIISKREFNEDQPD
jgi:Zn finger protein HypA/HybF involved in hydrogenase expression